MTDCCCVLNVHSELFCQSSDLDEKHTRITLKRIISYNMELCSSLIKDREQRNAVFRIGVYLLCSVHISTTWNILRQFGDKDMNDSKQRLLFDIERWSKCC